jgi:hypothetical protein
MKGSAYILTVEQRILVLHADELRPAMLVCNLIHSSKLPCAHRASTNVPNLACLNKVMQSFHGLFNWCGRVEAVDLEEVDVTRLKSLQGGIDGVEDSCAR